MVFTGQTASCNGGPTATTTHQVTVVGPPTVSITTPADGGTYTQGQAVNAAYTCADSSNGPGLKPGTAGCSGTVANGSAINTSTTGTQAFSVTATSTDGQTTTPPFITHVTGCESRDDDQTRAPSRDPGTVRRRAAARQRHPHHQQHAAGGQDRRVHRRQDEALHRPDQHQRGRDLPDRCAARGRGAPEQLLHRTFNGDTGYTASTASTPAISITPPPRSGAGSAVTSHITRQRSGRWATRTVTTPHSYAPGSSRSSTTNTTNPRDNRDPRAAQPRGPGHPAKRQTPRQHPKRDFRKHELGTVSRGSVVCGLTSVCRLGKSSGRDSGHQPQKQRWASVGRIRASDSTKS